jgi:hypothetical protein
MQEKDKEGTTLDANTLYPHAKTYDELDEYNQARKQRYEKRLPKYPAIKISLGAYALLVGGFIITPFISRLWMSGSMASIFFSFAAWLLYVGAIIAWLRYATSLLYRYNIANRALWIFAIILTTAAVSLQVYVVPPEVDSTDTAFFIGLGYFLLFSCFLALIFKKSSRLH